MNQRKSFFLLLIIAVLSWICPQRATAQIAVTGTPLPSLLRDVYYGQYHFRDTQTGDTLLMLVLNPITVYPPERFRNSAEEQFYWRTVRDVKRALPYAKVINSTLQETYEYLETYKTKKEKQDYLRQFERNVFNQYKPEMKKMTRNQGKILIKLINRETNQNSYSIVKAFLGTFRAGFWQTFGRFFGANLKEGYQPQRNPQDAMIERICVRVEQGTI